MPTMSRKARNPIEVSPVSHARSIQSAAWLIFLVLWAGLATSCSRTTTPTPPPINDSAAKAAHAPPDLPPTRPLPEATVVLPLEPIDLKPEEVQREAEEEAAQLQARFPDSVEALHVAAMLNLDLLQTEKAQAIWQKCVEIEPNHAGVRVGLATAAMGRGEDAQAAEILHETIERGAREAEVYRILAEANLKLGNVEEASEALQVGLGSHPNSAAMWLLLGQTELRLKHFENAEASLRRAISLGHETSEAYYSLATAYTRLGKEEEATRCRERFSELRDENKPDTGQWTDTIYPAKLRHVVTAFLANAGEVYLRHKEHEDAERLLSRAIALDPNHVRSLRLLAAVYYVQKRMADSRLVQKRLTVVEPNSPLNFVNLASISAEVADYQTVESALKHILDRDPQSDIALTGLAELYLHNGKLEQALWFAEEALRSKPTLAGYLLLARICNDKGDSSGARDALNQAYDLAPPILSFNAPSSE